MNSALQKMVDDAMRGRVMSLFMMTFLGMTPIASILAGSLSDWVGPAPILLTLGAITLLGAKLYLWKNKPALN